MFLSKVFKYNKGLAALLMIFAVVQLFVNFKRGMVVSPFFHYGMYSHAIKVEDAYSVWQINVNNETLRGSDFTPQQWDKILLPVEYYRNIKKSNSLYQNEVKRLLGKFNISTDDNDFLQNCNYAQFEKWYKQYLGKILAKPVSSLAIFCRQYDFRNNQLIPSENIVSLGSLCF